MPASNARHHAPAPPALALTPIGVVRSGYAKLSQAPRQPGVDGRHEAAVIELAAGRNFEQALEDLAGFERIWVVAWFDRAQTWKPKIRPPRGTAKRGLFATRSPHRPNPIALSVARLVAVDGLRLSIAETDLLDGTPVLDIKPYVPETDAFVNSRTGWLEQLPPALAVRWTAHAREKAEWLLARGVDVIGPAERVLALGVAAAPRYKRVMLRAGSATDGELAVESWRVAFVAGTGGVEVVDVRSGYPREVVTAGGEGLHQGVVHGEFWGRWEKKV